MAELLRAYGFEAKRDGRLDDDLAHDIPGVHIEVKFQEKLCLPEWTRQCEADARGRVPVVVYRSSRQPWRASLPLEELLRLLRVDADIPRSI